METKIITSDSQLRAFIPNAFAQTIPGAPSLFDKIKPFIAAAENWVISDIVGETNIDSALNDTKVYNAMAHLVAKEAYRAAIPSLDVVVSHNGVGVVETNTLKPASKAKMDALSESLANRVDAAIASLIRVLLRAEYWQYSLDASQFDSYIFCNPMEVIRFKWPVNNSYQNILEKYDFFRNIMSYLQSRIAKEWISVDIMHKILEWNAYSYNGKEPIGEVYRKLIQLVKRAVSSAIMDNDGRYDPMYRNIRMPLEEAVEDIRTHGFLSKIWNISETASLFRHRKYINSQQSPGFWF